MGRIRPLLVIIALISVIGLAALWLVSFRESFKPPNEPISEEVSDPTESAEEGTQEPTPPPTSARALAGRGQRPQLTFSPAAEEILTHPLVKQRAPVSCELSKHARHVALAAKFDRICSHCNTSLAVPTFCEPSLKVSSGAAHPLSALSSTRFDFSKPTADIESGDRAGPVTVVYSVLGQRLYGPGGQSYAWESVRQWRLFHPTDADSTIYMVMDDSTIDTDAKVRAAAKEYGVRLVKRSTILTDLWERYHEVFYVQGLMHPGGSKKTGNLQFNQLVSERLFAVHALMKHLNLTDVIHLENDIMVYEGFSAWISPIRTCGHRIASTIANVKGVIPGVVYFRDAAAAEVMEIGRAHV